MDFFQRANFSETDRNEWRMIDEYYRMINYSLKNALTPSQIAISLYIFILNIISVIVRRKIYRFDGYIFGFFCISEDSLSYSI